MSAAFLIRDGGHSYNNRDLRRSKTISSRRDEGRRSYSRSSYTSGGSSSSGGAVRSSRQSAPAPTPTPTYVTCHGLEVSNVDNYIANLFR